MSDFTEHACLVALVRRGLATGAFGGEPAWGMRWWMLVLAAGVGLATLRSGARLPLGAGHATSGVDSAGNGPIMRSAVIGAAQDDPTSLAALVRVSTRVTHTDPCAE